MPATEFEDSIPIELARIFLTQPFHGESFIYTDIMDEFPPFTVPADFEVLGSIKDDHSLRVYLRTASGRETAGEAISNAFLGDWTEIVNTRMGDATKRGFVSRVPFSLPRQFCHDEHGTINISLNNVQDSTVVLLTRSTRSPRNAMSCEEIQRMQQRPFRGLAVGAAEHMPRLELPEPLDDRHGHGIMPGGVGGSVNDAESRTTVTIDWPIARLHTHFEEQLLEQGWTQDTKAVSEQLAVSGWEKSPDDGIDLYGTFTVLHLGDNNHQLKFQLIRKNTGQPPGLMAARIVQSF